MGITEQRSLLPVLAVLESIFVAQILIE